MNEIVKAIDNLTIVVSLCGFGIMIILGFWIGKK